MADSTPGKPSSDRHSKPPKSVRLPPGGLEARLDAYTEATGMSANAVMVDAITEYLDLHAPPDAPTPP